jgi:hypothetical protein
MRQTEKGKNVKQKNQFARQNAFTKYSHRSRFGLASDAAINSQRSCEKAYRQINNQQKSQANYSSLTVLAIWASVVAIRSVQLHYA